MAEIIPGVTVELAPGVRRITAPNPGVMTGPGTNSYLLGENELALIDPGPLLDVHIAALTLAVGERLRWILCTHTHMDHSPAAHRLKAATGAQVLGRIARVNNERQDQTFKPDRVLADGDVVDCGAFTLRAVHTPGHASNHLCYLHEQHRLLFTGDHVMQGSTVVIGPPDGDMGEYLRSLARLLELDIAGFAPGHGHLIEAPHDEVRKLIAHRLKREQKALSAVQAKPGGTLEELVTLAYDDTPLRLHPVAQRSLYAHLLKLRQDGRVQEGDGRWSPAGSA